MQEASIKPIDFFVMFAAQFLCMMSLEWPNCCTVNYCDLWFVAKLSEFARVTPLLLAQVDLVKTSFLDYFEVCNFACISIEMCWTNCQRSPLGFVTWLNHFLCFISLVVVSSIDKPIFWCNDNFSL